MFSFSYPAAFRSDKDGRPVVRFPDFPEAHTDGKDMREAVEEAIDCLGSVIAFRIAGKKEIGTGLLHDMCKDLGIDPREL